MLGFRAAMERRHAFDPKFVFKGDYTSESGFKMMQKAIRKLGDSYQEPSLWQMIRWRQVRLKR